MVGASPVVASGPRLRTLLMVGGVAFLVFLAAEFPARLAWRWLGDDGAGLTMGVIEGSLWRGRAKQAFFEDIPLGEITWAWRPLALFAGELGARVTLNRGDAAMEGNLGRTLTALSGADVRLRVPVAELIRRYPGSAGGLPMAVEGMATADLESLVFSEGRVERIEGQVRVSGLMLGTTLIGDVTARVHTREGELIAELRSQEGSPVALEGAVALSPDGGYKLDLQIEDPATLGKDLDGLYRSLAKQTEAGAWRLAWQGSL